jgi:hypothetical protein
MSFGMKKDAEARLRGLTNSPANRAVSEFGRRSDQLSRKGLIARELLHRTFSRNASRCDRSEAFAAIFRSPLWCSANTTPTAGFDVQRHGLGPAVASLRQCFSRAFRIAKHLPLRLHPAVC